MTAEELVVAGRRLAVSGDGYAPTGEIAGADELPIDLAEVLAPMALCSDATVRHDPDDDVWRLGGDPTEGALVVLAGKGGGCPATGGGRVEGRRGGKEGGGRG